MKIQSINNQNQYKSNIGFDGKLIMSEDLSERALEFIKRNEEELLVLAIPSPCDMFVKELPTKEKNVKIAVIPIKNVEESIGSTIEHLIEEIDKQTNLYERMKIITENFLENMEYIKEPSTGKRKNRYYVPKKIGQPQKPFIKKKKIFMKTRNIFMFDIK